MKYLIVILLTLGCTNPFKNKPKTDTSISINTYLYNNRYIFIIQDPISYVSSEGSETLNEHDLKTLLENFKNVNLKKYNILKYKSLDIKNLQDVVKEIFGKDIIHLKSTAYRYKKHDIMIVYDQECEEPSKLEESLKELESLKDNINKEELKRSQNEESKKDICAWYKFSFKNLATYEAFIKETEKLFNCI